DDWLVRYPEHAAVLGAYLGLHDRLDGLAPTGPVLSGVHGRQRLLAALAAPAGLGGAHPIPSFFPALPPAPLAATAAVPVEGGAIGASAAMGGPNLPEQAWNLVSSHATLSHAESTATATATGTAAATTGATATSTGTPVPGSLPALCHALQRGSAQG